ncbi:MAG: hypothetical protein F6J93_25360 [Oscillatoria sp. SIO1A7]|nr:hypothetical protein [Oscillatoria sp. SIO1A7]
MGFVSSLNPETRVPVGLSGDSFAPRKKASIFPHPTPHTPHPNKVGAIAFPRQILLDAKIIVLECFAHM